MRYIFNLLFASLLTANLANGRTVDVLLAYKTVTIDGWWGACELPRTPVVHYTLGRANGAVLHVGCDLDIVCVVR